MGWISSEVFRFDFGFLLGQTMMGKFKSALSLLICGPSGLQYQSSL